MVDSGIVGKTGVGTEKMAYETVATGWWDGTGETGTIEQAAVVHSCQMVSIGEGATDYPGAYDFAVVSRSVHSLAVHAHPPFMGTWAFIDAFKTGEVGGHRYTCDPRRLPSTRSLRFSFRTGDVCSEIIYIHVIILVIVLPCVVVVVVVAFDSSTPI